VSHQERSFPIVRHPAPGKRTPVLVSVPHYGTQPLPHITRHDYGEPSYETFAYGFADTFVGDLYGDLHEQGATVLATPFSRIFVDVNRRRDDFEHQDGEVRSRRGVVRTHTMRDVPIFRHPLALPDLEERLRTLYDPYYATLERLLAGARRTVARRGRVTPLADCPARERPTRIRASPRATRRGSGAERALSSSLAWLAISRASFSLSFATCSAR